MNSSETFASFRVGDRVQKKLTDDCFFVGVVRSIFPDGDGRIWLVVENDYSTLHIYAPTELEPEVTGADLLNKLLDRAEKFCEAGIPQKAINVIRMLRGMIK